MADTLPPLPTQPVGTPWPTREWPTPPGPAAVPRPVASLLDAAFADPSGDLGATHAVVIVQRGQLLAERYAEGFGPDATCRSWSMAKSITQALVGLAVGDGRLDIRRPADAPAWRAPGDPRAAITLDHLLRMSSGLAWIEDYSPENPSDVIEMLFGRGAGDVAGFAEAVPLAHAPGTFFYYSSGTTNIVSACLGRALSASGETMAAFMRERLFAPLGMASAEPRFDAAGTFIGSSFCFCTPRDFARFGLLYLRDGIWEGRRLLPEGWVDFARTPTYQQPGADADSRYGAHWWLDITGSGSFSANGYEGQHIVLCPDRDLIVVRHGATPTATQPAVKAWLRDLAAEFG
jgi:CubicO group peptidase (beta-lactamase class C family)